MASLQKSHSEYLLRGIDDVGGKEIEATVFGVWEQPFSKRKVDPETSATGARHSDQFHCLGITERLMSNTPFPLPFQP
jgi:hypothetical protein